jgi:VIT1/CCC1 family predicted Fe2+/Mn2+ transporter
VVIFYYFNNELVKIGLERHNYNDRELLKLAVRNYGNFNRSLGKDEKKWVDFMMKFELGLEKPDAKRATKSAFNIGIAYIVGGIIPLMGYMFTSNTIMGLRFSAAITIVCLFIFGYYKSKLTGQQPIKGALRVTFIGIVAALAAYVIASLVKQ